MKENVMCVHHNVAAHVVPSCSSFYPLSSTSAEALQQQQRVAASLGIKVMEADAQERWKAILADYGDSPHIVFHSANLAIHLERHGTAKAVLLLRTTAYTYLIKVKACKAYVRFENRGLTVAAEPPLRLRITAETAESRPNNAAAAEFTPAVLLLPSVEALRQVEKALTWSAAAGPEWMMPAPPTLAESRTRAKGGETSASAATTAAAGRSSTAALAEDVALAVRSTAASRQAAVAALMDGDFADYRAVRQAYAQHEEAELLADLATFVDEHEKQVEKLCSHHYPAFLQAVHQCLAISDDEAQLVGAELSGATALVRTAVLEVREVVMDLAARRSVRAHLQQAQALLQRMLSVAEYLETAEAHVRSGQLAGAVASITELVRQAAPLAEYALGAYVLQRRVPSMTATVLAEAIQQMQLWLRVLREQATPIGMAVLQWSGEVAPGTIRKELVVSGGGHGWWVSETFLPARIHLANFSASSSIATIIAGASISEVFAALGKRELFKRAFTDGRTQQARVDLIEAHFVRDGSRSADLVADFERYCATAVGFLLIENTVRMLLQVDGSLQEEWGMSVLHLWERISNAMADRARQISQALLNGPNFSEHMLAVFRILRSVVRNTLSLSSTTILSTIAISRVVESLSDNIISWWLQGACLECTQLILSDALQPLTMEQPEQFISYVQRFHLDQCGDLELKIPTAYVAGASLPYSLLVPMTGDRVMEFLDQCYAVMEVSTSTTAVQQSELNNVDAMLLKYIGVLFRTIVESLHGQLMSVGSRALTQLAIFVNTCAVMPVLVSAAEQQFVLHWVGNYGLRARQKFGEPRLLRAAADLFVAPLQKGIERLLAAITGELLDRLKAAARISHWRQLMEAQRQDPFAMDQPQRNAFVDAMQHAGSVLRELSALLQQSVLMSVAGSSLAQVGLVMQGCLQESLLDAFNGGDRDFAGMRACVDVCVESTARHIPRWKQMLCSLNLPGLRAAMHFPLSPESMEVDALAWIDKMEAQHSARPQPLLAEATKAVAKGFQAMGRTMTGK